MKAIAVIPGPRKNEVLVLASMTEGDRKLEVLSDRINIEFVLGNKVMVGTVNAGREHFESGVRDMAKAEAQFPGLAGPFADASGQRTGKLRRTLIAEWIQRSDQSVLPSGGGVSGAHDSI